MIPVALKDCGRYLNWIIGVFCNVFLVNLSEIHKEDYVRQLFRFRKLVYIDAK